MLPIANRRAETLGLLDRKRLELARALATNPAVLLLDEIGGGLTDSEANELVVTIREFKGARHCDRVDRAHRARSCAGRGASGLSRRWPHHCRRPSGGRARGRERDFRLSREAASHELPFGRAA